MDKKCIKDWESILESEGLGPIDTFDDHNKCSSDVSKIIDISSIESERGVAFDIDRELGSINMYDNNGNLIGYIKRGYYTYGKVSSENHLEKKIFDDFIGKGYGQLLYDVYKSLDFFIPDEEYTHKASVILFLVKNGYRLSSKIDDNGDEIELLDHELSEIENDLTNLIKNGDLDLQYTYKLTL